MYKYTTWPNLVFATRFFRVPYLPGRVGPPTRTALRLCQGTVIKPFPQVTQIRLVKAANWRKCGRAGGRPTGRGLHKLTVIDSVPRSVQVATVQLRRSPSLRHLSRVVMCLNVHVVYIWGVVVSDVSALWTVFVHVCVCPCFAVQIDREW